MTAQDLYDLVEAIIAHELEGATGKADERANLHVLASRYQLDHKHTATLYALADRQRVISAGGSVVASSRRHPK